MSQLIQPRNPFFIVIASLSLVSCSLLQRPQEPGSQQASQAVPVSVRPFEPGWQYSKQWSLEVAPPVSGLGVQAVTLQAQCAFSSELVQRLKKDRTGVLLPVLAVADDLTTAPDLEASNELYRSLSQSLKLSGIGNGLSFYQSIIGGLEHHCPPNMTRPLDKCWVKRWLPFFGQDGLYDVDRIVYWYEKHPSVDYVIMNSASLYNSKAMLSSRYSESTRVITDVSNVERELAIRPHRGSVRFDWMFPEPGRSTPFVSRGFCSLSWIEMEYMREIKGNDWPDTDSLNKVSAFLLPYAIRFLPQAISTLMDNSEAVLKVVTTAVTSARTEKR